MSSPSRPHALAFRPDTPTTRVAIATRLLAVAGLAFALAGCDDRDPVAPRMLVPAAPRLAVGVLLAGPFVAVSATTDLGTLPGGTWSEAMAINRAGMVVGVSEVTGGAERAFRWVPGATALQDLGALPGHGQSEAYGINNHGQVAGYSQRDRLSGGSRAVLWHPSASGSATYVPIDLGLLAGAAPFASGAAPASDATGVNDYGQVVGASSSPTGSLRAFLWTPTARNGTTGTMQDLGTLPGCVASRATAINANGVVVGWAQCGAPFQEFYRAFLWSPSAANGTSGTMHDLGVGFAHAINNAGLIAGYHAGEAFVQRWPSSARTSLGAGHPRAISGAGVVAGMHRDDSAQRQYAGVWSTNGGSAFRFGESSEAGTVAASGINDAAQVVGMNVNGRAAVWQLRMNRAPLARPGGPYVTADTIPVQLNAAASTDPDGDELTYTWNFSGFDGEALATGPTPLYYPREGTGVHTVTVTVRDAHGGSHTASTTVTVHATPAGSNVDAVPLTPAGSYQSDVQLLFENVTAPGTTTITTSTTPPSGLPQGFVLGAGGSAPLYFDLRTTATFAGTVLVCAQYDPAAFASPADVSLLHGETVNGVLTWVDVTDRPAYPDAGSKQVCGKVTSFSPFAVVARSSNAKPALGTVTYPTTPQAVAASVQVSAAFTDGNPGDVHAVAATTIEWGDGAVSRGGTGGALVVREPQGATPGSVTGTHAYAAPGVYTVRVTVADRAGAAVTTAVEYVVVYDADAGFVTGGGWINSVAGAFKPNAGLAGKATFGFVSRYEKGASRPTGNTQFQFHAANLVFRSTAYDWLVVSPTRAMYHGTGAVSGLGAGLDGTYQFQLTAIDGGGAGGDGVDKFRIRIYGGPAGLLYDNEWSKGANDDPTTALGGGSIQIKAR